MEMIITERSHNKRIGESKHSRTKSIGRYDRNGVWNEFSHN